VFNRDKETNSQIFNTLTLTKQGFLHINSELYNDDDPNLIFKDHSFQESGEIRYNYVGYKLCYLENVDGFYLGDAYRMLEKYNYGYSGGLLQALNVR
jgi:hypothetical protein